MTISAFSDTKNFTLAENATTGALEIADQDTGLMNGLMAEVTGIFNGGKTGSVGLGHTIAEGGKAVLGAVAETRIKTGEWQKPFLR